VPIVTLIQLVMVALDHILEFDGLFVLKTKGLCHRTLQDYSHFFNTGFLNFESHYLVAKNESKVNTRLSFIQFELRPSFGIIHRLNLKHRHSYWLLADSRYSQV
jgi:hypothetical protein